MTVTLLKDTFQLSYWICHYTFPRKIRRRIDVKFPSHVREIHSGLLYLQENDGSVVSANEEDVYRYTTKRWLSNDKQEASIRYKRFNINELIRVALHSTRTDARSCTRVMKYREGLYNKAFLITFDNSSEVVAKIPNPNAGPNIFTTASEVATINYVRKTLGSSVPHILGWSCDSSNDVGSEYIIMEKAKGIPLGDVWYQLPRSSKNRFIQQVVDMEIKLASIAFSEHGCIYYSKDLPIEYRPKNPGLIPGDHGNEFCIGPFVEPILWSDERLEVDTSRGPWHRLCDYATSMGDNEKHWAEHCAKPRLNYYRSNSEPETPAEYMGLIAKYLLVMPHLSASEPVNDDLLRLTLWHTDLHLNNIYVDLTSETITNVIDWQGVTVAPLILQARIPRMVRCTTPLPLGWIMPEKAADYDTMSEQDKKREDRHYEDALCNKYYEVQTAKRNPSHYAAIIHNNSWKLPLIKPVKSICGAWSSREVFRLRSSLIDVVDHWHELKPGVPHCPISFTKEERKLHDEEMENRDYIEQVMESFQDAGILPADGIVDPEDYEIVKRRAQIQKETLLSMAENEEQRAWLNKLWPYQDPPDDA